MGADITPAMSDRASLGPDFEDNKALGVSTHGTPNPGDRPKTG